MLVNRLIWIVATVLFLSTSLLAGPPLLCHEIKVEPGTSLPWGTDTFTKDGKYNAENVVAETLALLKPQLPVLTRMETLRRATLYIDKNKSKADALLGKLMARALDAEAAGKSDALAWFDAGYLVQCYNQSGTQSSFSPARGKDGSGAIAGYSWVAKAMALAGDNGEMEIAAALMTADRRTPEHGQHIRRALESPELAKSAEGQRLLGWIAEINGTSLEALRAKYGSSHARRGG